VSEQPEGIRWVLTPLPEFKVGYRAVARCPHGTTEHQIFGRAVTILAEGGGLGYVHTGRTGCSCPVGEVVLERNPEGEEAPGG
jgi:hypothetical protein